MIADRVNHLKGKREKEEAFTFMVYILCKTFGWDYWTLMKQPIPFINSMIDMIIKENKESKKRLKKR